MYLDVSLHIIYINSKADRPFFRKVFQMKNKHQTKNFKYWCAEIKKNPRNEIIFYHWLNALIKETKGVVQ